MMLEIPIADAADWWVFHRRTFRFIDPQNSVVVDFLLGSLSHLPAFALQTPHSLLLPLIPHVTENSKKSPLKVMQARLGLQIKKNDQRSRWRCTVMVPFGYGTSFVSKVRVMIRRNLRLKRPIWWQSRSLSNFSERCRLREVIGWFGMVGSLWTWYSVQLALCLISLL